MIACYYWYVTQPGIKGKVFFLEIKLHLLILKVIFSTLEPLVLSLDFENSVQNYMLLLYVAVFLENWTMCNAHCRSFYCCLHLSESKTSESGNREATFVTNISDSTLVALLQLVQRAHLENNCIWVAWVRRKCWSSAARLEGI